MQPDCGTQGCCDITWMEPSLDYPSNLALRLLKFLHAMLSLMQDDLRRQGRGGYEVTLMEPSLQAVANLPSVGLRVTA